MFKVVIFDQEKELYHATACRVTLPGVSGEFEILAFHAPMIGLLQAGQIRVDGKALGIRKGVAMMEKNELLVVVER